MVMYTCVLAEFIYPLKVDLGNNTNITCLYIYNECIHILAVTLSTPKFCETYYKE